MLNDKIRTAKINLASFMGKTPSGMDCKVRETNGDLFYKGDNGKLYVDLCSGLLSNRTVQNISIVESKFLIILVEQIQVLKLFVDDEEMLDMNQEHLKVLKDLVKQGIIILNENVRLEVVSIDKEEN